MISNLCKCKLNCFLGFLYHHYVHFLCNGKMQSAIYWALHVKFHPAPFIILSSRKVPKYIILYWNISPSWRILAKFVHELAMSYSVDDKDLLITWRWQVCDNRITYLPPAWSSRYWGKQLWQGLTLSHVYKVKANDVDLLRVHIIWFKESICQSRKWCLWKSRKWGLWIFKKHT